MNLGGFFQLLALIERNLISAINVSIEKSKQLFYKSLGDSRQKFPSEKKR